MAGEIVVGYDGSPCAKAALRFAADIASHYNVGLCVAFCAEPPAMRAGGAAADQRRQIETLGEEVLGEVDGLIGMTGVPIERQIVEARPADGLIELADERDAPVIVVGTKGHGLFKSAILGSTPHKLLHWTARPVLVVPARD
jgi:nucleotide-binding universal stress UspA family protein